MSEKSYLGTSLMLVVKNPPCNARDMGSNPGQGIKFAHAAEQRRSCPQLLSSTQLESLCHSEQFQWCNEDPVCSS